MQRDLIRHVLDAVEGQTEILAVYVDLDVVRSVLSTHLADLTEFVDAIRQRPRTGGTCCFGTTAVCGPSASRVVTRLPNRGGSLQEPGRALGSRRMADTCTERPSRGETTWTTSIPCRAHPQKAQVSSRPKA